MRPSHRIQLEQRLHEKKLAARGMLPGAVIQHKLSGLRGTFKKWIQKYPEVVQVEDENGEKTNLDIMEDEEVSICYGLTEDISVHY